MAKIKEVQIDPKYSKQVGETDNDRCYRTGIYNDRCDCSSCNWKFECSGSEVDEDEED